MPSLKTRIEYRLRERQAEMETLEGSISAIESALGTDRRTITEDDSITSTDAVVFVDATAGDIAVELPELSERTFFIKKIDATANVVTISGAADIDGVAFATIELPYEGLVVAGGPSGWYIVGSVPGKP